MQLHLYFWRRIWFRYFENRKNPRSGTDVNSSIQFDVQCILLPVHAFVLFCNNLRRATDMLSAPPGLFLSFVLKWVEVENPVSYIQDWWRSANRTASRCTQRHGDRRRRKAIARPTYSVLVTALQQYFGRRLKNPQRSLPWGKAGRIPCRQNPLWKSRRISRRWNRWKAERGAAVKHSRTSSSPKILIILI